MKPYLKYALFTSGVIIAWMLVQYVTGLDRSDAGKYLSYLSYIVMIVFMILAMREQKQKSGGYLTYGEAFKTGMLMMVVVSVIMSVFTYIYFKWINPDFVNFAMEKARDQMEDRGMSEEQVDQAMGYAKMFMSVNIMTGIALFGNIVVGAILALIVAAFVRKEKPVS